MKKYTDGEIQGLSTRIEHCRFLLNRFKQLSLKINKSEFRNLKAIRGTTILLVQGFYGMTFYINLSELFRHFRKDEEINSNLKSTNDQRLEFRKKVRDVLAKSNDTNEYLQTFIPYITNCEITWDAEFERLIDGFKKILAENYNKAVLNYFATKLKEIDALTKANPVNLNYPEI